MARIASLIKSIREFVISQLDKDRTLVPHSGDYLSPSAIVHWSQATARVLDKHSLSAAIFIHGLDVAEAAC
jgi:hypothetical protein